jgi:uncharacterized protein YhfF/DNA-binding CsgD family transcriptional regulator
MWQAFCHHAGLQDACHQVTYFRTPPAIADRLIDKTLAGVMRACASAMHYFGEGREEPMPKAGDYALLLDSRKRPRLIWRATRISVAPLSLMSEQHAWESGHGGGDREEVLTAYRRGFTRQARLSRFEMHDDLETVFEPFELVWPFNVAQRVKLLTPYLERGFALRQRLDEAHAAANDFEALLARIETAVLTIDAGLRLRFANPAADVLLRRGDGLRLSRGALMALRPADMRVLRSAVVAATAGTDPTRQGGDRGPNNVVTIQRTGYGSPYRATVLPLARQHAVRELAPLAEVVVFIEDPDATEPENPAAEDLLRRAFHLTPGEARLAAHLASGISLTDAADAFGVTRNTVRAQLHSIFDKTEARRQSDLVRLLHSACSLRISLN